MVCPFLEEAKLTEDFVQGDDPCDVCDPDSNLEACDMCLTEIEEDASQDEEE